MRTTILAVLVTGGLFAADTPKPAAPGTVVNEADVKTVVDTIQGLSGLLDNLDTTATNLAEGENKGDSKIEKQGRPLKGSIAIITAGAAAGASIGAATKKGTQAIVIGAIAGAAAGLIYDRMTAEKKNTPEKAPEETQKPEINKQQTTPVPAT